MKHIILGAGGSIGKVLLKELTENKETVKLVSRNIKEVTGAEILKADITDSEETMNAVEENSVVYLLAGLPYNTSIWQQQWPKIMKNVVEACRAKNSKLIFFDNIYLYGKVEGKIKEDSPVNPCSKKGEVRAGIIEIINAGIKDKSLNAIIARAADFYGPYSERGSIPFILMIDKLAKGKRAQILANAGTKHSYTYTCDCGKALYLLAKNDAAVNQVWHLPTANPALTSREFIEIIAQELNGKPGYTVLRKWMLKLTGIFNSQIKEIYEMLYQNEFDYIFDSTKFEEFFSFKPTTYKQGISETIIYLKQTGLI